MTIGDIAKTELLFKWFLKEKWSDNIFVTLMYASEKVLTLTFINEPTENLYFVTYGRRNEQTGEIFVRISGYQLYEGETLLEALFWALVELMNHVRSIETGEDDYWNEIDKLLKLH